MLYIKHVKQGAEQQLQLPSHQSYPGKELTMWKDPQGTLMTLDILMWTDFMFEGLGLDTVLKSYQ